MYFSHSALFLTLFPVIKFAFFNVSLLVYGNETKQIWRQYYVYTADVKIMCEWSGLCECCLNFLVQVECNHIRKIGNVFSLQKQLHNWVCLRTVPDGAYFITFQEHHNLASRQFQERQPSSYSSSPIHNKAAGFSLRQKKKAPAFRYERAKT